MNDKHDQLSEERLLYCFVDLGNHPKHRPIWETAGQGPNEAQSKCVLSLVDAPRSWGLPHLTMLRGLKRHTQADFVGVKLTV